jgi:glycosyltransferase involved in cell wall biosynthesis
MARPDHPIDGCWRLLSVARLEPQKNLAALIEAFAALAPHFPDWQLRIVGEGSLRTELQQLTDRHGIRPRVGFAGAIDDIDAEYAAAHLFCLASRWEGFPNAMAEAMAHGLPVIGFDGCPGVNALVAPGVDGLLAPGNGDVTSLTDALRRLMNDARSRQSMGQNAARIANRFDATEITLQWERVIAEAAGVQQLA